MDSAYLQTRVREVIFWALIFENLNILGNSHNCGIFGLSNKCCIFKRLILSTVFLVVQYYSSDRVQILPNELCVRRLFFRVFLFGKYFCGSLKILDFSDPCL